MNLKLFNVLSRVCYSHWALVLLLQARYQKLSKQEASFLSQIFEGFEAPVREIQYLFPSKSTFRVIVSKTGKKDFFFKILLSHFACRQTHIHTNPPSVVIRFFSGPSQQCYCRKFLNDSGSPKSVVITIFFFFRRNVFFFSYNICTRIVRKVMSLIRLKNIN